MMRFFIAFGLIAGIVEGTYSFFSKQYIVTFRQGPRFPKRIETLVSASLNRIPFVQRESIKVNQMYSSVFKGFVASIPSGLVPAIKSLPLVADVEEDAKINLYAEQNDATWGLERISQSGRVPSEGPYKYRYNDNAGEGVAVYIIDSGVRVTHNEFEGRAVIGKTFIGENDDDENGHGTHVAGTVAGKTYGVAKKAQIIACKVFDGSGKGSFSHTITAIEWAISDKRGRKGNVINMSLGGIRSSSINRAVDAATKAGITVVVAAGNSNLNSFFFSPASSRNVITVGATNINDTLASFSNYGTTVDILAPGQDIISSWNDDDNATNKISGTSMASPHVAGLAAYYHSLEDLTNIQVMKKIRETGNKDKIKGTGQFNFIPGSGFLTVNLLANNGMQ